MKNARNETSDNADIDNQAPPTMMIRNIPKNARTALWNSDATLSMVMVIMTMMVRRIGSDSRISNDA